MIMDDSLPKSLFVSFVRRKKICSGGPAPSSPRPSSHSWSAETAAAIACGQNPKFRILRAPAGFHPEPPRERAIKLQRRAMLWDPEWSTSLWIATTRAHRGLMQCRSEFQLDSANSWGNYQTERNLIGKKGGDRKMENDLEVLVKGKVKKKLKLKSFGFWHFFAENIFHGCK